MLFRKPLGCAVLAACLGMAVGVPMHASASSKSGQSKPAQAKGSVAKKDASRKSKAAPASSVRNAKADPRAVKQTRSKATAAAAATGVTAAVTASSLAAANAGIPNNAEARLLDVIKLVEEQKLDAAIKAAASLTADVPNFRAAQLVYADLLRFKTGRPGTPLASMPQSAPMEVLVKHTSAVPANANVDPQEVRAQLHGLQDELKRRVKGSKFAPPKGSVPRDFLQMGASVRHAMAIDASKSRLYLFVNEGGKLRLVDDFYVSVAKLGLGKAEEGDQRTPLGVYFIGQQIPGPKLPDFYGKGALTLNYPNDWDRMLGRSGSGIWLHGSPSDQFARLPESSDGCVVLANPDLIQLMRTVDRQTPVLIRDKLDWVAQADASHAKTADAFMQVLNTWQQAWKNSNKQVLGDLYAIDPGLGEVPGSRLEDFFRAPNVSLQDISMYSWKDAKGEIRIVDLKVRSKNTDRDMPLRQYWRKSGERWKLFSERLMG